MPARRRLSTRCVHYKRMEGGWFAGGGPVGDCVCVFVLFFCIPKPRAAGRAATPHALRLLYKQIRGGWVCGGGMLGGIVC